MGVVSACAFGSHLGVWDRMVEDVNDESATAMSQGTKSQTVLAAVQSNRFCETGPVMLVETKLNT